MPRLHHLADARPIDFYDCFSLDQKSGHALREHGSIRLFGNANIGINDRTNTQVAGSLVSDQTAYLQNVYARTNLAMFLGPDSEELWRALHEFASSTQITLVVGDRPQRQWPLATLLGRKHGDRPVDEIPPGEAKEYFEGLAKLIIRSLNKGKDDAEDARIAAEVDRTWASMLDSTRASWMNAAREVHRHLKAPQLVIIPPRQHHSVLVTIEQKSLGKLLEVLPGGVAPMPLVWVHLEGFSRRDVC